MLGSMFHTGFVVRDIESSIRFYTDVMGLNLQRRGDSSGENVDKRLGFKDAHVLTAFLHLGNDHSLELVQYIIPTGEEPKVNRNDLGASHLGFYVENIDEFYATMSKKGLRFCSSPQLSIREGKVIGRVVDALDPDNNLLEFVERAK